MNKKVSSGAAVLLGVLLLVFASYQLNQYFTTQPLVKQGIKAIERFIPRSQIGRIDGFACRV